MILTDLKKLSNTCSLVESNVINNYNTSMYNICSNTAISIVATKRTIPETSSITVAKCTSQRTPLTELPKEVLSTVTLTNHMVSAAKANTLFSYRSIKGVFSRCNNSNISKHNTNISADSCCTSKCLFRTNDGKKKKLNEVLFNIDENYRHISRPVLETVISAMPSKSSEPPAAVVRRQQMKSIFLPSFKYRHRKSKTTTNKAKNPVKASKTLTLVKQQQSVANTSKPTPLITVDATTKLTKKCKVKKTKPSSFNSCKTFRVRLLPGLKVTSIFSLLTLICLETVLLSTVSNCAKTFYMHWNTSNSIFRIDNTDHIIDVNKGNLAFEFDQVHIICPVYEPGTYENETEKYIIYNVSKVEYETCRITNADPRVIAICDKPQKLMFFTITFRPFTPQPGGLEFLPGNDYYFISTSSKDDLYRRIGGRCSTNNMKVVFKVCCAPEDKNNKTLNGGISGSVGRNTIGTDVSSVGIMDSINSVGANGSGGTNAATAGNINQQHINSINTGLIHGGGFVVNNGVGVMQKTTSGSAIGTGGTSINTNIDQFNRIQTQTNSAIGMSKGIGLNVQGSNGVLMAPGVVHGIGSVLTGGGMVGGQFPGHQKSGIRINNVPSLQQHPSLKSSNVDDHLYNKHPNEVVKNEELTYNSAGPSLHCRYKWNIHMQLFVTVYIGTIWTLISSALNSIITLKSTNIFELEKFKILDNPLLKFKDIISLNINPTIIISVLLATLPTYVYKLQTILKSRYTTRSSCQNSLSIISKESSYVFKLRKSKFFTYRADTDTICLRETNNNVSKSNKMSFINSTIAKYHDHILSTYHSHR